MSLYKWLERNLGR